MPSAAANADYARGLARALGGAIIFGLPLLMTMEMWAMGHTLMPARLLLVLGGTFVVLVFLSRFGGFEHTSSTFEDVLDALAAYAVAFFASAMMLGLFGLIEPGQPLGEVVGMVAIQSVPASFGAMLARKQLSDGESGDDEEHARRSAGYGGQLFLMLAGGLFLAFNAAPTEEMILIAFKMSPWHSLALMAASLVALHVLVFAAGFAGQEAAPEGQGFVRRLLGYTVPGYAIALLASLYILWTFGRADSAGLEEIVGMMVVLGFPASVGAAIARLVV
jgi:putative integral membrane protein (TIGR02587 family)